MKITYRYLFSTFLCLSSAQPLFAETLICTVSAPGAFTQDLKEPLNGFGYVAASVGPIEAMLTLETDSYDVSNVYLSFRSLQTKESIYNKSWFFCVDPTSINSYTNKFIIEDTFTEPHTGSKINYICRVKADKSPSGFHR